MLEEGEPCSRIQMRDVGFWINHFIGRTCWFSVSPVLICTVLLFRFCRCAGWALIALKDDLRDFICLESLWSNKYPQRLRGHSQKKSVMRPFIRCRRQVDTCCSTPPRACLRLNPTEVYLRIGIHCHCAMNVDSSAYSHGAA